MLLHLTFRYYINLPLAAFTKLPEMSFYGGRKGSFQHPAEVAALGSPIAPCLGEADYNRCREAFTQRARKEREGLG